MSGFLLDTNVISEIVKPSPNSGVLQWIESTDESLLCLSVLTVGEVRKGIALWGRICGTDAARKSPLPVMDGLIAATALHHNLTLVSRDTKPAKVTGVEIFDPWIP